MRTGGLVRLCGFVVPILDLFLRERSHADHDLDALALLLPGHEVGVSWRRHRGCGALLGLPERRPDCVRARVRAADAPSRRLVCRDGGPRADGQRNTKACGFGEFGGSTPPGRRRLRGVVPAPAGRPPGAARALSLARARRGAPRPASLGTAADPVLGRSIYLFVCRRAARARTRTHESKRVFQADSRIIVTAAPPSGVPHSHHAPVICTARAAAWFGPRRASVRGLNTPG